MRLRIVTTITSDLDLDTLTPSHSVEIDAEDAALPNEVIYAVVAGGLRATWNSIAKKSVVVQGAIDEEGGEEDRG